MEGNTILQKYYQGTVFSLFIPILYVIKVYVYSLYDVTKDIYSSNSGCNFFLDYIFSRMTYNHRK